MSIPNIEGSNDTSAWCKTLSATSSMFELDVNIKYVNINGSALTTFWIVRENVLIHCRSTFLMLQFPIIGNKEFFPSLKLWPQFISQRNMNVRFFNFLDTFNKPFSQLERPRFFTFANVDLFRILIKVLWLVSFLLQTWQVKLWL